MYILPVLYFLLCTSCSKIVKGLSEGGFNVMVTGGKIGELALHFLDKYKIMAVRCVAMVTCRITRIYHLVFN